MIGQAPEQECRAVAHDRERAGAFEDADLEAWLGQPAVGCTDMATRIEPSLRHDRGTGIVAAAIDGEAKPRIVIAQQQTQRLDRKSVV